jgi:Cof subfamily protein (haloacid dehalogenase superfamily)
MPLSIYWHQVLENKFRLLAFDLDGTTLINGTSLSAFTIDALKSAKKAGCRLAVCTGRPETLVPRSVSDIPFLDYIISANGAMIRELKNGRILSFIPLDTNAVKTVYERKRQSGAGLQVHFPDSGQIDLKGWYRMYRYMKNTDKGESLWENWQNTKRFFSIHPVVHGSVRKPDEPIIKMVCVYRSTGECKDYRRLFSSIDKIEVASTLGIDLEITAKEATKGHALGVLCREISIEKCNVFAIGDNENDISMRAYAGCLVAMGNATQRLLRVADYITGCVHDDGAARAIRRYICGLE